MDTIQLTLILRKDKFTRGVFQGVYPSDKLPASVSQYPALYIANVDTSDKPGSHWVAFYFTKEQEGEFFDSYGAPPSKYSGTFTTFLNNNSNQWTFNTVTLQSIYSKVCGHYCLYRGRDPPPWICHCKQIVDPPNVHTPWSHQLPHPPFFPCLEDHKKTLHL